MTPLLYIRPQWIYGGASLPSGTGRIYMPGASMQWVEGLSICVEGADI